MVIAGDDRFDFRKDPETLADDQRIRAGPRIMLKCLS